LASNSAETAEKQAASRQLTPGAPGARGGVVRQWAGEVLGLSRRALRQRAEDQSGAAQGLCPGGGAGPAGLRAVFQERDIPDHPDGEGAGAAS